MARQAEWQKRVAQWRASGLTAQEFAAGRGFAPSTLTWWARRFDRELDTTGLRVARVIRGGRGTAAGGQTPRGTMVVELGTARVHVPVDVDTASLERVLTLLGEPGRTA